jgi:DNA-binding NtrC family response regulator
MRAPTGLDGAATAIIGRTAALAALRARLARVAPTEATVLILGERGTGKELVARAIHAQSRRRDRAFVAVNCAAVPTELLASELFGHERGAFTGATERGIGLVRAAEHGTLFLDEVGELPRAAQAMLLRFLEEREIRPVGSARSFIVDVRVVAATNKPLDDAVAPGEFRADLLDRLCEVIIEVPPLRDRLDDIPLLVEAFVTRHSRRHAREAPRLSAAAARALRAHDWPGNVRELEHAISRAVILADDGCIRESDLGLAPHGGAPPPHIPSPGLTPRQLAALRIADERGAVRRQDLVVRFGVSTEAARLDLADLVRAGLLRRSGTGRGTRYEPTGGSRDVDPGATLGGGVCGALPAPADVTVTRAPALPS